MENISGANPFIDQFMLDPLELLYGEQHMSATRCDTPFKVVPTIQNTEHHNNTSYSTPLLNSANSPINSSHLTMLMPESLKVIVGEYTFALSSHLKIGVRYVCISATSI